MSTQVLEPTKPETADISAAPKKRNMFRAVLDGIVTTFLLAIIIPFTFATAIIPALLGINADPVLSGSMEPSIPTGAMVFMKTVDADTLQPGDVISYLPASNKYGGLTITHRVESLVTVDGEVKEIITKGDANPVADAPITPEQVTGKMMLSLPFAGYPYMFLNGTINN